MPKTTKKIAVIILNWNGEKLLEKFLPNVVEHSSDLAKIYVIDNASNDNSVELLNNFFPAVQTIELPANYGYAGGYNRGMKYIDEEYAVLLNSDVEVTAQWLQPLLLRFENNDKLAALQPKIKDLKNPGKFEYAGASGGFMDTFAYPFCRGRIFTELETDKGQYDDYREIFWASGACLMVRKKYFEQLKGFNEHLFAHMEEIDLCWRMHLKSYEVACEPASSVYHLGGATLNKISPQKTYLNFRNSLIVMFLNLPTAEAFAKIMARLMLDAVAGIKFLLEGKFSHMFAIIRAHYGFYSRFNELARQKIGHNTKPFRDIPGVYNRSIVQAFYLRKKKWFSKLQESQ